MATSTFYLETSVWGSLAPHQPRDRTQVVHRLLRLLDGVRGKCVIGEVVLAEIHDAPEDEAREILHHINRVNPDVYTITDAMESLAQAYLMAGVLPESRRSDARHVAAATCLGADFLVSWNHRHMTRPRKRLQYELVNQLHNYLRTPLICNPFEACHEI
jgi:hypothetical protein